MSGVRIELTLQASEAIAALGHVASADLDDLAFNVGALLESSTQERIATRKAAPDGTPWAPWSEATAARRGDHHSLLVQGNYLLTSVQNYTEGWTVKVGSNLVYAAIHQAGGKAGRGRKVTIPARPYLGLSAEDTADIEALIADTVWGPLQ